MTDHHEPLAAAIQLIADEQIGPTELIHGWTDVPTGDVIVFISDKDLDQAIAPVSRQLGEELGRGRTLVFAFEKDKWSLVAKGFWGGGVSRLRKYFKAKAAEDASPRWQAAIDLCNQWLFWDASPPTTAEADAVLARSQAEPNPCPVWRDMQVQIVAWLRHCRFKV